VRTRLPPGTLALFLACCGLPACAAGGASPLVDASLTPRTMLVADRTSSVANRADTVDRTLRAAEIGYVTAAAAGIFRRRPSERSATLVPTQDHDGYGVCLRSPAAAGSHDHALIVFGRRLDGEAISQVDDDTLVLRRAADTVICRSDGVSYVTARAA
jgi:hypothetical protein